MEDDDEVDEDDLEFDEEDMDEIEEMSDKNNVSNLNFYLFLPVLLIPLLVCIMFSKILYRTDIQSSTNISHVNMAVFLLKFKMVSC